MRGTIDRLKLEGLGLKYCNYRIEKFKVCVAFFEQICEKFNQYKEIFSSPEGKIQNPILMIRS